MPAQTPQQQRRQTMKVAGVQSHPPEPENLPCPRCDSTNTKFCYYNNYNLSQPRYFCKGCRRYWTRGGTLRNVPVGGGSRKNSKRCRSTTTVSTAVTAPLTPPQAVTVPLNSSSFVVSTTPSGGQVVVKTEMPSCDVDFNLNEGSSFTSLLTCDTVAGVGHGSGAYTGLSGYGLGLGFGLAGGFEEMGYGLAFGSEGNQVVSENGGGNTWQLGGGGGVMGGGDHCFQWPDLAISTPGNGLQ